MLRTARAEMAATLGFISLAADTQTDAQTDVVTSQHSVSDFISFPNTEPFLYGIFTLKFFYQVGGLQLYFATNIDYKRPT